MNAEENAVVSVTVDADLLREIDKRAKELDINRSQYFRRLAREEIAKNKPAQPELLPAAVNQ